MASVAVVSKVMSVTAVHQDTSTTPSVNCVAAVVLVLFLRSVMVQVDVFVNLSSQDLVVNSADLDFTLIQTVKSVVVTSAPPWTSPVLPLDTVTVAPTTAGPRASSVHQVTMVTPAAHRASAPLKALGTVAVTCRPVSVCVCLM